MTETHASLAERVAAAVSAVREQLDRTPQLALRLGDVAHLGERLRVDAEVPLDSPEAGNGAAGEAAPKLIFGDIGGVSAVVLTGTTEGAESLRDATFPVRVARGLGAEVLIVAGRGQLLNPLWEGAPLMLIVDHINLLGGNPLVGSNSEELGPRFPDMSEAYDNRLRGVAEGAALSAGIRLVRGVYIARATATARDGEEAALLRNLGGDAVGAGIVPDTIVAVHGGMRVVGLVDLASAAGTQRGAAGTTSEAISAIIEAVAGSIQEA